MSESMLSYKNSPVPAKKHGGFATDAPGRRTALGIIDGHWDYPSSRGAGIDRVKYSRRNFHPAGGDPLPIELKMKDLTGSINRDLKDAARSGKPGELRSEFNRHINLLEKGQLADPGTVSMLRGFEKDLTGVQDCDREQLDVIEAAVSSCGPRPA